MERVIIRALLILGIVSLLVYVFAKEISHVYALHTENEKIKVEIQELVANNTELRKKIEFIEQDTNYVEKIIRDELGMIKKGEKVYRFND